jgi:hypothetical protein
MQSLTISNNAQKLQITVQYLTLFPASICLRKDLQTTAGKDEIRRYSSQYSAHQNDLAVNLMEQSYSTSNTEILECSQSKALRMIMDASW